jgi:hypothetical protein
LILKITSPFFVRPLDSNFFNKVAGILSIGVELLVPDVSNLFLFDPAGCEVPVSRFPDDIEDATREHHAACDFESLSRMLPQAEVFPPPSKKK